MKQQGLPSGNMMMNPNNMQPNNQQNMHHPVHQNAMANGPMGMARMNPMQQSNYPVRFHIHLFVALLFFLLPHCLSDQSFWSILVVHIIRPLEMS